MREMVGVSMIHMSQVIYKIQIQVCSSSTGVKINRYFPAILVDFLPFKEPDNHLPVWRGSS